MRLKCPIDGPATGCSKFVFLLLACRTQKDAACHENGMSMLGAFRAG